MEADAEFRKQVKDALEHLYDTAYLETHPLLAQYLNPAGGSRLTRAQMLRSLVKDAVESLRPQEGSPAGSPEWRSYLSLRYRYVQGMSPGETEIELGISLRQLQRELHKGLDAVTALLWEKRTAAPPVAGDAGKLDGDADELETELSQWEITRTACEVQTLVDDAVWMLRPMMEERGIALELDVPASLAPVFVDATLTRQALFKVLRVLVKHAHAAAVSLAGRIDGRLARVLLSTPAHTPYESEADWQTALLICRQQGVDLAATGRPDGGLEIVMALPLAPQSHILVVDDNAAIHQLFERYLAPHHYAILHASNGPAAIALAADARPDAITLDVMMPNVDGWQVLRSLTGNAATAGIPVIVCSVLKEPELAFSLGARAYLKKPVDRLELVATLARLLSSAAPAAAVPPPTPEDS